MILDETLQLLRTIYRGQRESYLTLTAIHPSKKLRTPSRHLHITDKVGIHQALTDLMQANQMGWGAYFSVALRKEPLGRWHRGGHSNLLTLTALYADLDGDLSQSFERIRKSGLAGMPSASAMIGSGRGLHLYWFIEPTDDFEQVNCVLAGLAKQLGGDEVTAAQALRLPGSRNTKPEVNRPCRLLWLAEDRHYILSDFATFAEPPSPTHNRWRAPPPALRGDRPPSFPDQINPELIEAVVDVLMRDYGGFAQPNGWIGSLCPAGHSVDRPGKHFALLPAKATSRCFGRHGQILLKDLCELLNLDPADYGGLYRKETVERNHDMAKKKSRKKNTDTVILIRIPDANARQGKATLTIQRGDLGHIHQFEHTGLSLKSDIAEAVQEALQKLANVEAAPPPVLHAETSEAASETPAKPDTDNLDNTDTDDTLQPDNADADENDAEMPPNSPPALDSVSSPTDSPEPAGDAQSVSTTISDSPPESPNSSENDADSPENVGVSTLTAITDTDDTSQENPAENTANPPEELSVSVMAELSVAPSDQQQISLF